MPVIKSIEDLKKIRDQAKDQINLRVDNESKTRVVVGMGTCGIAAGARQVMLAILEELKKAKCLRCHSNRSRMYRPLPVRTLGRCNKTGSPKSYLCKYESR